MLGISSGSFQSIVKGKRKAECKGLVSTPEHHTCSYWFVCAWISVWKEQYDCPSRCFLL